MRIRRTATHVRENALAFDRARYEIDHEPESGVNVVRERFACFSSPHFLLTVDQSFLKISAIRFFCFLLFFFNFFLETRDE